MMVNSAHVQIKLTPENERRISDYIEALLVAQPAARPSPTAVANHIIAEWFKPVLNVAVEPVRVEGKP